MRKGIVTLLMAGIMCMSTASMAFAAPISVKVDGTQVEMSVQPIEENGTAFVAVSDMADQLGAKFSWDATKKQATMQTVSDTVVFTSGSKQFYVNGQNKTLETAAKMSGDNLLVPVSAFAEAIGAKVNYDPETNTATVDYFSTMSGSVKVSGSTTVQPIAQAAADKLLAMNKGLTIAIAGGGSGAGIKDSISGANNVGMSSRALVADEASQLNQFIVANDGIAIIVNPANPVKNLTKDQAAKIFSGEIKNWKDVGGNNAPIFVQTRETGSGTLATLEEMLLNKGKVVSTATPYTSSALIKQGVAKNVNAIGFDSIGFVDSTVKAVSIDGIMPNDTTVKDGTYAMSRNLLVVTKGEATDASAKFVDYLLSLDCQENIVEEEGYISYK